MKLLWISILFILLILIAFEMFIYILYLIIKALKTYIDRNSKTISEEMRRVSSKKPVKGIVIVAVCNVLIIVVIIATVYIQRSHDIYYTENVIICENKFDMKKFTGILDEAEIKYEVLAGTRVKMLNRNDFLKAENIIKDNHISFSTIILEQ